MGRQHEHLAPLDKLFERIVEVPDGCWAWTGGLSASGYGQFTFRTALGQHCVKAHRAIYAQTVGPIPEGLELDHVCRRRACVNPDHLEPVTHRVNQRRAALDRAFAAEDARRESA